MNQEVVDHEVQMLREEITRLGEKQDDGSINVTFGTLFNDERCEQIFEAIVGTLKSAKKRGVVSYKAGGIVSSFSLFFFFPFFLFFFFFFHRLLTCCMPHGGW